MSEPIKKKAKTSHYFTEVKSEESFSSLSSTVSLSDQLKSENLPTSNSVIIENTDSIVHSIKLEPTIADIEDICKSPPSNHDNNDNFPPHFSETWRLLSIMRGPGGIASNAAVDTMGCSVLGDVDAEPRVFRFQTLVSLILSSQTKDEITSDAVTQLKSKTNGLSAQSVLDTDPEVVHACISKVGFHNNKLKFLIGAAQTCVDKYEGDIPSSAEALCELKGVGPKMAHLCMQAAWGVSDSGIGVDVHVHRISNRLGWVKTKNPEQTRVALEKWLPKDKWSTINNFLVGLGQKVCKAKNPNCAECLLAELCPSSTAKSKQSKSKTKTKTLKTEVKEE